MTRNERIEAHVGLVPALARRFPPQHFDDLCSVGYLALVRAADLWEPRRASFSTCAYTHVWGALRRWWRAEHGERAPRLELVSLDAPPWEGAEVRWGDLLPDTAPGPEERATLSADVQTALATLSEKDRRFLVARFWGGWSLERVGAAFGVSGVTAARWERVALRRCGEVLGR